MRDRPGQEAEQAIDAVNTKKVAGVHLCWTIGRHPKKIISILQEEEGKCLREIVRNRRQLNSFTILNVYPLYRYLRTCIGNKMETDFQSQKSIPLNSASSCFVSGWF